ncbi:cation:dicarboxylate symporter family transporter, partial [Brachybacterium sp.]
MSTSTPPSSTAATRQRNPLRAILGISFGWQVLIGLVLGIILGLVAAQIGPVAETDANPDGANWLTTGLDTIGTIFVTLLKALVPPLIFLAIVTSIANLRNVTNAARLAWKTLLWFA